MRIASTSCGWPRDDERCLRRLALTPTLSPQSGEREHKEGDLQRAGAVFVLVAVSVPDGAVRDRAVRERDRARVLRDQRAAQPGVRRAGQLSLPVPGRELPRGPAEHDDLRAGVGVRAVAAGHGPGAAAQRQRLARALDLPADLLL